uniref:Uncharacterized protein n=1 Tax=Strigamia maritima TaxID=126957 RepID=T1JLH9_STRMM
MYYPMRTVRTRQLHNIIDDKGLEREVSYLKHQLHLWQLTTTDPWICTPHGVLEPKISDGNKTALKTRQMRKTSTGRIRTTGPLIGCDS